jgi:CRISPR-associated protein Cas1
LSIKRHSSSIYLCVYCHRKKIGVTSECLTVKEAGVTKEYPLNRLKSVQIAKRGVSFSSDVIIACANRGIKFFIQDFKNETIASISGTQQHAVVRVRQNQFEFIKTIKVATLSALVIEGKIKNQRATLLYFKKYHQLHKMTIDKTAEQLNNILAQIKCRKWQDFDKWNEILLGLEGQAASQYWQCLVACDLMPNDFKNRIGRQAQDVGNKALNYGYAILTSYIWNALLNAGLEPYCGFFHTTLALNHTPLNTANIARLPALLILIIFHSIYQNLAIFYILFVQECCLIVQPF